MHRLFVAVRPPSPIRLQLLDLMEGVRGVRWQDEDQFHLTLRFIGEVERHQAEDIAAALGTIHQPRFDLSLSGLGTFGKGRQATTLWAGVAPHEPLKALHKKVDQALSRVGIPPDHRAYSPHITLARLKPSTGPIDVLMQGAGSLASPPFTVDSFCLFESMLSAAGAIHSVVERYPLD